MKIVINSDYGGFSLSEEAYQFLGLQWDGYGHAFQIKKERTIPALVKCVETLGRRASGDSACLEVVEIPDGANWTLQEYDGREYVVVLD